MTEVNEFESPKAERTPSFWSRALNSPLWTPKWVRWDPDANHDLTWGVNVLFGFVSDAHGPWLYDPNIVIFIRED